MNNEEDLNIPHPDPAWDYYIEWHKLIRAKAQLEKVVEFISTVENFTEETQEILVQDTAKVISTLESI
ncbi:MAG: hypothetical protein RM022_014835 [Nostoc sp. EfeVER01]|uniref:hypothetical protein n=1 Tax=unclassified Nostoc TaxID=2593658 RepID=UPI002AD314F4|nr:MULTISPECIES: hypothetical protein [unclassified Nostoc]MDZ7946089.1 hypothetical protein [Nostoc sp. EfeVER01]MDZ7992046.1 hypothetical protein [Nostoc sp. EspVER01]